MKGKPFFISAIVFGGLGFIILVLTLISFFCGDDLISGAIAQKLNLSNESFNDATMAQISIVLFIPAFIFGFRAFSENDEDDGGDKEEKIKESIEEEIAVVQPSVITAEAEQI